MKGNNKVAKQSGQPAPVVYKVPPHNVDIEKVVLGTCLIEREAFEVVNEIITTDDVFYLPQHQLIYVAMRSLFLSNRPIDILTVQSWLKENNHLESIGGPYFITTLTDDVVSSAHLQEHCLLLMQKCINRRLIEFCQETIVKAYQEADCFDNCDVLVSKIEASTNNSIGSASTSMEDGVFKFLNNLDHRRNHQEQLTGVPSGYVNLDRCTNGWQNTDLIVLAARPGVGKTAFAINMALRAARHPLKPTPVALFSLEMSTGQIVERMVAAVTEMNADDIRRGKVTDDQYQQLRSQLTDVSKTPIHIDDTPAINSLELRARCRRMKRMYNIGLIIVDYLQLMSDTPNGERRNREQQISNISRDLKKLAKDLNVPIIALSQLSRAVETRGGEKIPQLSDLRESGAIEQDADIVAFLYRLEYYDIASSQIGETHLKIAKHRNGTLETIKLIAHLNCQKFDDASESALIERIPEAARGFKPWHPVADRD